MTITLSDIHTPITTINIIVIKVWIPSPYTSFTYSIVNFSINDGLINSISYEVYFIISIYCKVGVSNTSICTCGYVYVVYVIFSGLCYCLIDCFIWFVNWSIVCIWSFVIGYIVVYFWFFFKCFYFFFIFLFLCCNFFCFYFFFWSNLCFSIFYIGFYFFIIIDYYFFFIIYCLWCCRVYCLFFYWSGSCCVCCCYCWKS